MTGDHRDDEPLPLGEGTVRMVRPSQAGPSSSDGSFDSESTTRRMVRDEALDAAIAGLDEDIPELAMTGKMPAKIERRALPFKRRQEGARQVDQPPVAPFTATEAPSERADTWAQGAPPAAPSFDAAQLPSALMPTSDAPPPVREADDDDGTGTSVALVALAIFVGLAVVLVFVALFAV